MRICERKGFVYSGTQYGVECFCGSDETNHLQHGESDGCDFDCQGNTDEKCGGFWSMNVRQHV
ncbi:unnamed protein product [Hapterophycus canaliculatus]